eukprot:11216195-Lingulodinium_polyedra.AAC.1
MKIRGMSRLYWQAFTTHRVIMREAHRLTTHSTRPARPAAAISSLKAYARALQASKQRTFPEARSPVKAT